MIYLFPIWLLLRLRTSMPVGMKCSAVQPSQVWIMMMRSAVATAVAVGSTSVSRQDDWFLIRPSILISIRFFDSSSVLVLSRAVCSFGCVSRCCFCTVQLYRSGAFVLFCSILYVTVCSCCACLDVACAVLVLCFALFCFFVVDDVDFRIPFLLLLRSSWFWCANIAAWSCLLFVIQ